MDFWGEKKEEEELEMEGLCLGWKSEVTREFELTILV